MSKVELANEFAGLVADLKKEIGKAVIGQQEAVNGVLISIFCNGHCLLVGVPGLAKTLLIRTIADTLAISFNRIQFTPDLMPSDITGSEILDENRKFNYIKGPIFANIVLADEINRTPPKTQAALLEAMQEKNVTAAGKTYALPSPFFVLATQNPIEQEGTYPLPEAQLDRFMFTLVLDYPNYEEELRIIKETTGNVKKEIRALADAEKIKAFQTLVREVPVPDNVIDYAVNLVTKTRPNNPLAPQTVKNYLSFGAGPRAGQFLVLAAKCLALMKGKLSPDIEEIKEVAVNVLRHRVVKNYKAEAEGMTVENIIQSIL
jgi:MoxR-like ATPase